MFSVEQARRTKDREEQREKSKRLALRKKGVRKSIQKYDRRLGRTAKASGGGRGLKDIRRREERLAEQTATTSARLELVAHQEEPGYVVAEGAERTFRYRQLEMVSAVPVATQKNYFNLQLEQLGPYYFSYSNNGRNLLMGGARGHIALIDWQEKQLVTEFNVRETVRDAQFLHNELLFAVAQKRSVCIYDQSGLELHCLKNHSHVNRLDFLPYHFLLVSADDHGSLRYLDTSTGQSVAEIRTKLGALKTLTHNPRNAVVLLGHFNGCVSLWAPNVSSPLVKLQCHRGPLTSLTVDPTGHYLLTAAMDATMKVWDVRTYQPLHTYHMKRPVVAIDVSGRGLLGIAQGQHVGIWRDALSQKQSAPYLTHRVTGDICSVKFCPYEDCLGIGHALGFSSMLVPGAGEPNFDALEANPYQTKRQRQEAEVKQLLEKIPPELIQLDPGSLSSLQKGDVEEMETERHGLKQSREKGSRVGGKALALKQQAHREQLAKAKRRMAVNSKVDSSSRREQHESDDLTASDTVLTRFR